MGFSKLYITSDNGGGNGSRVKLWKKRLRDLANIRGLEVQVSHFPLAHRNGIRLNTGCFAL
jgi:hypothetical protein